MQDLPSRLAADARVRALYGRLLWLVVLAGVTVTVLFAQTVLQTSFVLTSEPGTVAIPVDFRVFWAAARLAIEGQPLAAFDTARLGEIHKVDPEAFKRLLDINVLGVFHTVRATLPSVLDRRGYVLIVSSLAAYTAAPGLAPYNASKAAVEHFANALRLEVGYRGVDVGSAHMSWIDTALVRDCKSDLSTFAEMLTKLPWPISKTTSVDKCGEAFVAGIEGRKTRVNCPGWVGALRWLRPLLATRIGEVPVAKFVPDLLPRMDAEVAALGRSSSAHTEQLDKG